MKNTLSLHEAIVVALINLDKRTFTASFDEIAAYIEERALFPERRAGITLAEQVRLRSTLSGKRYAYLFEIVGEEHIRLQFST